MPKMATPNALIHSDHGPMIINIHDSVIGKYISQTGYWANDDIELIKHLIDFLLTQQESVIFYDVGANIGTHALALSKIFGKQIKIRAFEAQRQIFNMLCGTMALNGVTNVFAHQLAVSNQAGQSIQVALPNYDEPNNFGGLELMTPLRSDNQDMHKSELEDVMTTTLDSFQERIDFIKMDIEGMEDKALMGAQWVFNNFQPICFVEILKTDVEFITHFFQQLGYVGFRKNADLIAIPLKYQIQLNGLERLF